MQSIEEQIQLAKDNAAAHLPSKTGFLRKVIYEITRDAVKGTRPIEDFIIYSKSLTLDEDQTFKNSGIDVKLLLINSVKMQDINIEADKALELEGDEKDKFNARKGNLVSMVQKLLEKEIFTQADCKIHFSYQLLVDTKVVTTVKIWESHVARAITSVWYKQNKFNLAKEHVNGYSSLINDLVMKTIDVQPGKTIPLDTIPSFLELVQSRIGVFYLDPNRVLGILLDVFVKEVLTNFSFWLQVFEQWSRRLINQKEPNQLDKGETPNDFKSAMSQLLGFKFQFYHNVTFQAAPVELYYACALLISKGLVDLESLLPYLSPSDEKMTESIKEYLDSVKAEAESMGGGLLASYAELGFGEEGKMERISQPTSDAQSEKTSDDPSEKYPANDILELAKALLSIGEIQHADVILSRYVKICDMYPILSRYIYRFSDVILEPAFEAFVPDVEKSRARLFNLRTKESMLKTQLRTDESDISATVLKPVITTDILIDGKEDYQKKERQEFFYGSWREKLAEFECSRVEHLTERFMPFLRRAGYKSYLCPELIHKLIVVVRSIMLRGAEFPGGKAHCSIMLREILLPAISYSNGNPGTIASVWDIMSHYTIQERGALYYEWGNRFYKKTDETKLLKAKAERSIKTVLQSVSKNDRQCGRNLGKLVHSHPIMVFSIMLDQVQKFTNQAPVMASCCRYMGSFAYDVIGYVLTEKWSGSQGPGRTKKPKFKDGWTVQSWLGALAVFSGVLYKSQGIDPTLLLRYLAFRLRSDDSAPDLILLSELISKVGELEVIDYPTEDQIAAAGCGDEIKKKIFKPKSDDKGTSKRVLNRLKEVLQKENIAIELLVGIHWLSERSAAKELATTHELYKVNDSIHQAFLQYHDLLTIVMTGQEYSAAIPDAKVLLDNYDLPPHIIMHIVRPRTQLQLRKALGDSEDESQEKTKAVLEPLFEQSKELVKDSAVWEAITPEFYATFWQLDLYDIQCPSHEYYETYLLDELTRDVKDKMNKDKLNEEELRKLTEKKESVRKMLKDERPRRAKHVENIMQMLKESQSRWFSSTIDRDVLIQCILQHCILPRSKLSEVDGTYCYEFVMMMHKMSVENFSSLTLFNKLISESLPNVLMTYTENETRSYARFIYKTVDHLSRWLKDEELYKNEAHGDGLIGFNQKWGKNQISKGDLLPFDGFKKVMRAWHEKIFSATNHGLLYGNSLQITNAFLILERLSPCFPTIKADGERLIKTMKEREEKETRGNLKILTASHLGKMKRCETHWVSENVFLGLEEPEPKPSTSSKISISSKPSTPKPSTPKPSTPKLAAPKPPTPKSPTSKTEASSPKRKRLDESPVLHKKLRSDDESRNRREPSSHRQADLSSSRDSSKEIRTSPDTRRGDSAKSAEHSSRRDTSRKEVPPTSHHESPRTRDSKTNDSSRSGSRIRKRPEEDERDRNDKRQKDERPREERVDERRDRDRDRHRDRDRDNEYSHRHRRRY